MSTLNIVPSGRPAGRFSAPGSPTTFTSFPSESITEQTEDQKSISNFYTKLKSITSAATSVVQNVLPGATIRSSGQSFQTTSHDDSQDNNAPNKYHSSTKFPSNINIPDSSHTSQINRDVESKDPILTDISGIPIGTNTDSVFSDTTPAESKSCADFQHSDLFIDHEQEESINGLDDVHMSNDQPVEGDTNSFPNNFSRTSSQDSFADEINSHHLEPEYTPNNMVESFQGTTDDYVRTNQSGLRLANLNRTAAPRISNVNVLKDGTEIESSINDTDQESDKRYSIGNSSSDINNLDTSTRSSSSHNFTYQHGKVNFAISTDDLNDTTPRPNGHVSRSVSSSTLSSQFSGSTANNYGSFLGKQFALSGHNGDASSDNDSIYSSARDYLLPNLNRQLNPRKLGGLGKDFWMKDENASECFGCSKLFTAWRRKHHCRICGQIFCSSCTDLIPGNKFNYTGRMRVCYSCLERIDDYASSSDASSNFDPNETTSSDYMGDTLLDSPVHGNSTLNETCQITDVIIPQENALQPAPLMAIPAARNGTAVEIPLESGSMSSLYRLGSSKSLSRKLKERNSIWDGSRSIPRDHFFPGENSSFTRYDNKLLDNIQDDYVGNDSFMDKEDESDATYESEEEDEHAMSLLSSLQLDNPSEKQQSLELLRSNTIPISKHNSTVWRPRRGTDVSMEQGKSGVSKSKIRSKSFVTNKRGANSEMNKNSPSSDSGSIGNLNNENSLKLPFRFASVKANSGGSSELNQASRTHSKSFLKQLLMECKIENVEKWIEALTTPLLQCAENIDLDIRGGDSLDIRQYVQLKKIEGGVPKDIAYICGVVFSKSLALKTMPRDISNPRIALIMFPIEYHRTSRHFMSLEPILAQEKEYIRKLAKRIISLSPDIVLAGSTVNGHALELLSKSGIAVAYNVKESVITKVARYTKADIIWSIDKLAVNPKLGFCESFSVKTYRYKAITKTYFIFSGCAKHLGCTILLRGGDERILSQVKMCVEFMVHVIFSLKLETSVLRDEFVLIPNYAIKAEPKHDNDDEKDDSTVNFLQDVVKFQANKILSSSPSVQFEQPYLLTQARDLEDKLVEINGSVGIGETTQTNAVESNELAEESLVNIDFSKYNLTIDVANLPGGNKGLKKIMETINHENYQRLYNLWSTQKNQLELSLSHSPDMFNPRMHQNITVLYSLVSNITATPCVGPEITNMEFYRRTDLTLGQFVEGLCLSVDSLCHFEDDHGGAFGCEEPLINHYRSYVHGKGRINVVVEKFECRIPGMQNTILMWSYCRKCKVNVPVIPMSENTWKYSFGKYLELSFWSTNVQMRAVPCSHNVFRDHVRFFGLYDYVVRFEYDTTDVLELVVPSTKIVWRPESDIQIKYDQFVYIQEKINRFWESVLARFARVKIDGLLEDRVDEFKSHVENLRSRANQERKQAVDMLNELYTKTRSTEHLPLNRVLSFVQDMAVQWDTEFLNFESDFFPSEKDITRITAQQLRNIFTDKNEDSFEKTERISSPSVAAQDTEKLSEKTPLPPDNNDEKAPILLVQSPTTKNFSESVDENTLDEALTSIKDNNEQINPAVEDGEFKEKLDDGNSVLSNTQSVIASEISKKNEGPVMPEDGNYSNLQRYLKHFDVESGEKNSDENAGREYNSPEMFESTVEIPIESSNFKLNTTDSLKKESTPRLSIESKDIVGDRVLMDSIVFDHPRFAETPTDIDLDILLKENSRKSSFDAGDLSSEVNFKGNEISPRKDKTNSRVLEEVSRMEAMLNHDSFQPQRQTLEREDAPMEGNDETINTSPLKNAHSRARITKSTQRIADALSPERNINKKSLKIESPTPYVDSVPSKSPMATTSLRKKMVEKAYSPKFPYGQTFGTSSKDLERHLQLRRSGSGTHSRVSSLARHFDQLSREFEKERAKERRLLAEGQFRAFPVANAKPIIEVYDSVEDAVEELSASEDEDNAIVKGPNKLPELNPECASDYSSYSNERAPRVTTEYPCKENNQEFKEEADEVIETCKTGQELNNENLTNTCDLIPGGGGIAPEYGPGDLPQISEKQSLLKTLANFWADRSATGWNLLEYPLIPSEHIFVDSDVIVREDEPSSLIAFCLSSSDYLDKLHSLRQNDISAVNENASAHVNADNLQIPELERWMGKPTATHLKYRFGEGSAKLMCKIFYPEQFNAFRIKCGCDEHYIQSLSRCVKWDSSGGKSGSAFLKTLDDRLVIKQLSQNELDAFIKFAPNYFEYMSKALFHDLPTVLAKIFGFYQVQIKNPLTNKAFKMDVLVMENLFYKRKPTRIFDLKGSMRNRHVKQTGKENEVLLDENMVEYIYESPLFVREHAKRLLRASLWNDTLFLAQMNVMDYSLVIGIDSEKDELVVGIIDCMRTFTWDKKLESWVKERGLVGGGNKEPTVVTPKQYKNRFREAMERYILMVPDCWYRG